MVPDQASLCIDLRTMPGKDHAQLSAEIAEFLSSGATVETLSSMPAMWTNLSHPWVGQVFDVLLELTEQRPLPQGGCYFTDGGVLYQAWGLSTLILGARRTHPGPPDRRIVPAGEHRPGSRDLFPDRAALAGSLEERRPV